MGHATRCGLVIAVLTLALAACTGTGLPLPQVPPALNPPAAGPGATAPIGPPGRIALTADGNQHDQDDWAGSAMTLAILAQQGLQANVVHHDFNNHIWDSAEGYPEKMVDSVMEGGERFGFDTSKFYDATDPEQLDAGTKNLTAAINASTEDDELWLVLAGPMETAWMALDAANEDAREHVKCLSHGEWNEEHGKTDHGGHDYDDLIDLGCQKVQIPDQNSNLGETDMDDWDYLNDAGDDNLEWLYARIDLLGNGDVSDAGLVCYIINDNESTDRPELRELLEV